jgi:hypothetical protein
MTQAEEFVSKWLAGWNSHNLSAILSHYTDDFEMTSPAIVQITGKPEGRLIGKVAIGAYWEKALTRFPELNFKLIDTFVSVNSLAINYTGVTGKNVIEVFHFNDDGLVNRAYAYY